MTGSDGSLRMDELLPVAAACGSSPEQIRSGLRRLVAEGVFEREGSGRNASYHATPAGTSAITPKRPIVSRRSNSCLMPMNNPGKYGGY